MNSKNLAQENNIIRDRIELFLFLLDLTLNCIIQTSLQQSAMVSAMFAI